MQRGEGNSNSFSAKVYNPGSDQNNVVPNSSAQNANNSLTWIGGTSLRQDSGNHIGYRRLLDDDIWLPSPENQSENSQTEEAKNSEEANFNSLIENMNLSELSSFLESNNQNLGGDPVNMEFEPITGQASSGTFQNNLDLNNVVEECKTDNAIHQENGPKLSLDHSASAAASGSSVSPVIIHSGSARYVIEESPSTKSLHPEDGNKRLSCKRSAPENGSGSGSSSDSGGGSSSAQLIANSEQPVTAHAETSSDNNNPNRIPSAGLGINQAALGNFLRSTRLRSDNNIPANLWTWNPSTNSNIRPLFQPFNNNFSNTSSASVPAFLSMSPSFRFPHMGENYLNNNIRSDMMPQFFGNRNNGGGTMLWRGSSSNSANQLNNVEGMGHQEDNNLMNNRRGNVIPVLGPMQGNLNLNLNLNQNPNPNPNFFQTFPSSSSMRPPQENVNAAISQALQDLANHSEPWRELNFCPIHHSGPSDPRIANFRNSLPPLRLPPRSERQSGNGIEVSPISLPQSTPPRTRRMVSEVRNAYALVRRDGGLHLEDVMVIDRPFFVGRPESPDHEDLPHEVENMSFEEILQLEEQFADGFSGLSEELILANLKRRKYLANTFEIQPEAELCVICQEEYEDEEELGKVDCGHDFHFDCIKQWLAEKNSCPICKKVALVL